jgi:hypothetical protein
MHDPPRNTSGNALLSRLLPPNNNATYDAVTLRLSFSCTRPSTRVQLRYVFGSNEFAYTLAHDRSNDVMGAFLNGKMPSSNISKMGRSSGRHGCARRVPVTLYNVVASDLSVDNEDGDRDTSMAGFTTPMVAPGPARDGNNQIFIALADARDGWTGSWLFIEHGSFMCLP